MKYYLVLHEHRHGVDYWFFKSKKNLDQITQQEVITTLMIDFEEYREESIEIIPISNSYIPEIL